LWDRKYISLLNRIDESVSSIAYIDKGNKNKKQGNPDILVFRKKIFDIRLMKYSLAKN